MPEWKMESRVHCSQGQQALLSSEGCPLPALCLKGFTQFGRSVEKNCKTDEMTVRDNRQRKWEGLGLIRPKEVAKRSGNMSSNIKMAVWSVMTKFQSSLQSVMEISSNSRCG